MLKTRVIPILLFKDPDIGLVKSVQFDWLRTVGNPINSARVYNSRNVDELIFLDIGARRDNRSINYKVVNDIFRECFMPLTVGGKIETVEDVRKLLLIGADKISINTTAIEHPELISEIANSYGSQCVVISIDAKKSPDGKYLVYSYGGQKKTDLNPTLWAQQAEKLGGGEILITSIDRDGTRKGYDLQLIKEITSAVKIPVIAAGGAGKPEHFIEAVEKANANALAAASIFHFTQFTPNSIKQEMQQANIPVRL